MRRISILATLVGLVAVAAGCATHGSVHSSAEYTVETAVYSENPVFFEGRFAPACSLVAPERSDEAPAWPSENPVFDSRFDPPSTGAVPEMTPSPEFFADRPGYSGN